MYGAGAIERGTEAGGWTGDELYADGEGDGESPSAGTPCSRSGCENTADTWDHITPLVTLFSDEWPESISEEYRKSQFYRDSNLQPMCRSHNSSKGGRGETYDPLCATASMVFKALGESEYCNDLIAYGYEMTAKKDEILEAIDRGVQIEL